MTILVWGCEDLLRRNQKRGWWVIATLEQQCGTREGVIRILETMLGARSVMTSLRVDNVGLKAIWF